MISFFIDTFMLFFLQEIRNRHWLQVMSVTGVTFQLEANVFKLSHLLDIGLIKLVFFQKKIKNKV